MKSVLASVMVMAVGLAACRVSVETQTRYTRADGDVEATASEAYAAGDKISVRLLGVNASGIGVSFNGGVVVNTADTDKVSVKARVIAYGYSEDEPQATDAIGQVAQSVKVTKDGAGWVVSCDQAAVGDADAGCEYLEVIVPRGTDTSPLNIAIDSELGTINGNFQNDVVSTFSVNAKGASPEILASARPALGARIELVSDDGPVRLNLPSDVDIDAAQLSGRSPEEASTGEEISDCDFPGANFSGNSFTVGEVGQGAALVRLSGETVRLKKL